MPKMSPTFRSVRTALCDLPEPYRTEAINNILAQDNVDVLDRHTDRSGPDMLHECFHWGKTEQGWVYWNRVSLGDHPELNEDELRPTGIEAMVCRDVTKRQAVGLRKYGVSVQDNLLSPQQWGQHLYEELLDAAVYLRRLLDELDRRAAASKESRGL